MPALTPGNPNFPQSTEAALASQKAWQPPGLFLLFFVEMWERFSYYGMRGLLVLYLVATLQLPTSVPLAGGSNAALDLSSTVKVAWRNEAGTESTTIGELTKVENGAMTIKADVTEGDQTVRKDVVVPSGAASSVQVEREGNGGRGWTRADATLLYGWYTGLAYLLPIIGGLIADRLLGTHRSMLVGGITIALGHIVLAVSGLGEWDSSPVGMSIFIGGLALIVLGTGHFKPCVSVMVGQLYPTADDPRRDGGFSIFYMGINLGAFICNFVCGTLAVTLGWHWGFGAAAVGMVLGLIIYMIGRPRLLRGVGEPPPGVANWSMGFILISSALAAVVGYLFHVGFFGGLVRSMASVQATVGTGVMVGALLAAIAGLTMWLLGSQERSDRAKVAAILVFIVFNTVFWMAFEQAGSTLNLFAEINTNRRIGGWEMPATWFQSLNPLLIITLAPLFALLWPALSRRRIEPLQAGKIGIGLLLVGAGYIFMVYAGKHAVGGVQVGMFWLFATYFMHTLGELCLSPTGLSFVTKTAPLRFISLLMGIWFLSSFAAGVLGGQIGSYVEAIERGEMSLPWYSWFKIGGQGDFFLLFVIVSIAAGVLCLALGPVLNRMSGEKA